LSSMSIARIMRSTAWRVSATRQLRAFGTAPLSQSTRWLRMFLANAASGLGWALKGSCRPCAHRLFTTARWLVPEAQRYRTGSHNRNFEFAVVLGALLSRMQLRGIVAGFLIVVTLVGLLDLAMRATATGTQPVVKNSTFQSETGSLSGAQSVPLPLRKPEGVFKAPNKKGAKAKSTQKKIAELKKKIAELKRARPKPTPGAGGNESSR
jgi:hypothetical protein